MPRRIDDIVKPNQTAAAMNSSSKTMPIRSENIPESILPNEKELRTDPSHTPQTKSKNEKWKGFRAYGVGAGCRLRTGDHSFTRRALYEDRGDHGIDLTAASSPEASFVEIETCFNVLGDTLGNY